MITGNVQNEQFDKALDGVEKRITQYVKKILAKNARLMQTHVRAQYMSGITGASGGSLKRRSGTLAARTIPIPVREVAPGIVTTGLSFGTRYARTHIGPRGSSMHIRAKNVKYLTIPLDAMKTKAGVARGDSDYAAYKYGNTFVRESKKGNLIIFASKKGRTKARQGESGRQTKARGRSQLIPLFLLKKEVTIRRRIHPKDILNWIEPKIIQDFKWTAL